jgi:hypothetical protein
MRRVLLVLSLVSLPAAAQTAQAVCGTVLLTQDKTSCFEAIAGHSVEPAAAAVCQLAVLGRDKVACLRNAVDKRYSPEELAACRAVMMSDEKAQCMAVAGHAESSETSVKVSQDRSNIERLYYRREDSKGFQEVKLPRVASTNGWVEVKVPNEKLEVCAEKASGQHLDLTKDAHNTSLIVTGDDKKWVAGRCSESK